MASVFLGTLPKTKENFPRPEIHDIQMSTPNSQHSSAAQRAAFSSYVPQPVFPSPCLSLCSGRQERERTQGSFQGAKTASPIPEYSQFSEELPHMELITDKMLLLLPDFIIWHSLRSGINHRESLQPRAWYSIRTQYHPHEIFSLS